MSWNFEIVVDTTIQLEILAQEVSGVLGLKLQIASNEHETWYEYSSEQFYVTVGKAEFFEGEYLNLANYPYSVVVWPNKAYYQPDEKGKWYKELAKPMFDKLKALQKYSLVLVFDSQEKLEEYTLKVDTLV